MVLVATLLFVALAGCWLAYRIIAWKSDGWAGLAYLPTLKSGETATPRQKPGVVLFVFFDGPAARAGIHQGDML